MTGSTESTRARRSIRAEQQHAGYCFGVGRKTQKRLMPIENAPAAIQAAYGRRGRKVSSSTPSTSCGRDRGAPML